MPLLTKYKNFKFRYTTAPVTLFSLGAKDYIREFHILFLLQNENTLWMRFLVSDKRHAILCNHIFLHLNEHLIKRMRRFLFNIFNLFLLIDPFFVSHITSFLITLISRIKIRICTRKIVFNNNINVCLIVFFNCLFNSYV